MYWSGTYWHTWYLILKEMGHQQTSTVVQWRRITRTRRRQLKELSGNLTILRCRLPHATLKIFFLTVLLILKASSPLWKRENHPQMNVVNLTLIDVPLFIPDLLGLRHYMTRNGILLYRKVKNCRMKLYQFFTGWLIMSKTMKSSFTPGVEGRAI